MTFKALILKSEVFSHLSALTKMDVIMDTLKIIVLTLSLSMSFTVVADVASDAVAALAANPDNVDAIVAAAVSQNPDQAAAIVEALVTAAPQFAAAITTAAVTAAPQFAAAITTAAVTAAPQAAAAITTAAVTAAPQAAAAITNAAVVAAPQAATAIMNAAVTTVLTIAESNPNFGASESVTNNTAIKENAITADLENKLEACADTQCRIDAALAAWSLGADSEDLAASLASAIVDTVIATTDSNDATKIIEEINDVASAN